MDDNRPITPEQALLAVKGAGLDPNRSLNEQLNGSEQLDEKTIKGWVIEAISEAMGAVGQGSGAQPTDLQSQERRFAEGYRHALNKSRTPWFGEGADDAA
jgi:hypothetical protein